MVIISRRGLRRTAAAAALCAALAATLALVGCTGGSEEGGGQSAPQSAGQESATRVVTDMQGNEVEVPSDITNAFNGYPVNCGIMSMLGASDSEQYYLPRLMSDNWEWLRELDPSIEGKPTIGDDAMASAEEVLTIDPDVVLLANDDTAATYREAGITPFMVNAKTTDEFLESVVKTGELFGGEAESKAREFADYYRENIDFVQERIADVPESERPSVYYVGGTTAYDTKIKGNGIEFVTNAGGVFALSQDDLGENKQVTPEQLLAADPDVIIVGTNNRAKGYESVTGEDALSSLPALRNGAVYKTPQGTLPWDTYGPEQSMAVLWMAKTLYPDRFEDVDLEQTMKDFYERFYGYELSDEYAELMLAGEMGPSAADGR